MFRGQNVVKVLLSHKKDPFHKSEKSLVPLIINVLRNIR